MKKSIAYAVSKGLILLACSQAAFADGVEYKVVWDQGDARYRVYMTPDATPRVARTLSAQVTLRIPHGTLPSDFTNADIDLLNTRAGASWSASSRAFAPVEDTTTDYVSFTPTISNSGVFALTAGEEQELFSFHTGGACLGLVTVMDNETDPFNPTPGTLNSAQSNPGNEFSSLMWADGNDFLGIYGAAANCADGVTNNQPVAIADTATVQEGDTVDIDVLANDSDADGDTLTLSAKTDGQHGTVSLKGDQFVTYTPDAGFTGTDSFTYTATDGQGGSATGTVSVTVTAEPVTNKKPVAIADTATVQEGDTVDIDVLANDSDADGDTLTLSAKTDGQHGTVSLKGDQFVTYTPDAGFTGTDSFTYTATDGQGGSATGTVSVTVTAEPVTNKKPVAIADTATVQEGDTVDIDVLANDSDADGDTLTLSAKTDGQHGTVSLKGDQSVTYTPDRGFTGTDSFTYTTVDGQGGSATGTVSVTVTAEPVTNKNPVAIADTATVQEGDTVEVDVLANDSDADGDTLTLSAKTNGQHGTATLTYYNTVMYAPDAGFTGTDAFTYTVTDDQGGSTTGRVSVTVTAKPVVNQPPVADDDTASVEEGDSIEIDVLANDSDAEGDELTLKAVGAASGGATRLRNGKVLYMPDSGFSGIDRFYYTVSDAKGAETTAQVTVTVISDSDRDGDGLDNDEETRLGTDPDKGDTDGDGVSDAAEVGVDPQNPLDNDHDGIIDALDDDDDNDSILSIYENYNGGSLTDTDSDFDGTPDYLDPDDDNDGLLTAQESPDSNGDGNPNDARDLNRDGRPDYLQQPGQFAARSATPVPTLGKLGIILMSFLLAGVVIRKYLLKKALVTTKQ